MGKRARKLSTSSVRLGSSLCAAVVAITAGSTQPASGDLITRLGPALMMQPAGQPVSKPATPAPVPQPKLEDAKEPDTHGPKAADTKAPDNAANLPDDGPSLRIGKMVINYRFEHPQAPAVEELMKTEVELGQTPEGYVKPRAGIPTVKIRLSDVPDRPFEDYRLSGIAAVTDAIRDNLAKHNVVGVLVFPRDIGLMDEDYGKDLRAPGSTDLHIEVITALASTVRTLAFGTRVPYEQRVNNPIHQRIRDRSPIVPAESLDDPARKDLIRKDNLDDYVYRLNRHGGRKVNVALSVGEPRKSRSGEELPTVSLDYLVIENKPWFAYFQLSNTGTESTGEWRERFGLVHNQLTGRDDTLSLDFVTAGFKDSNALIASYEAPWFGAERLRWRTYATWNNFTASDIGQNTATRDFEGDGWSVGGELIANVFQYRELFIDVVGGVKWQHVRVEDASAGGSEGSDDFFLPYVGMRLERNTDIASTLASVNFEFNAADIASTSDNLDDLGRPQADNEWTALQWDVSQSLFLEPILIPTKWRDIANGSPTLAHEVVFGFKGQYAFDNRLIPSFEQVIGGLYTVRGYKESAVAGDGIIVGTAEYRFHVPKAMKGGYRAGPDGRVAQPGSLFGEQFRWKPQQPYGSADWDLILKGFVDVGRTIISDVPGAEDEETLIGAGLGLELQIKSNFNLRLDWGMALEDVESADTEAGDNRFHFQATILF